MWRNSRPPPAVPLPVENRQLRRSKSEFEEFNAAPLVRIILIISDRFKGRAVFSGRFGVKHLKRVPAADCTWYDAIDHDPLSNWGGGASMRFGLRARGSKGFGASHQA